MNPSKESGFRSQELKEAIFGENSESENPEPESGRGRPASEFCRFDGIFCVPCAFLPLKFRTPNV